MFWNPRYYALSLIVLTFAYNISCVLSQEVLGFWYDGETEIIKREGISHFEYDWNHMDVDLAFDWIFAGMTTFWTAIWLYWHNTRKPSFKFEFHICSRISIRAHIISGSLEFILFYFAYGLESDLAVEIVVYCIVACDMVHGASAYYQMPSVYGQKYVTVPAYFWVITLKLAIAFYLVAEPLSDQRLWALYFSHAQFTWLRLLFFCFGEMKIFSKSLYTVCMFAGIILLQSFISGENGCFLYVMYTIISIAILKKIKPRCIVGGKAERSRNSAFWLSDEQLDFLSNRLGNRQTGRDKAEVLFEFVDADDTGAIEYNELYGLFTNCGVHLDHTKEIFDAMDQNNDGVIDKDEFVTSMGTQQLVVQFEQDIDEELKHRYSHRKDWQKLETVASVAHAEIQEEILANSPVPDETDEASPLITIDKND